MNRSDSLSWRKALLLLVGWGFAMLLMACGSAAQPEGEPPSEQSEQVIPTALVTQSVLVPTQAATAVPALPERRLLTLEYPPEIHAGDSQVVRLTLEVDEEGNLTPTAVVDGNEITGETVEIPNLYETHTIIAESRLDLAGVQVLPEGTISEPLSPGKKVQFFWSVRPENAGDYSGTVWLYLRFVPKDGGVETRRTLSAQVINISATTLFGLKAAPARTMGAVGSFIGAVLGFPFVDDILKYFWKRIRSKDKKEAV